MATLSDSESRRLYSWWWDSHISPKNSKWLQESLTDMDSKVKSMIKLIEEDADSFARRAEMYYKKRPELMKLVEEFYRAYRALAERYNHATGELHQAHCTIAEALSEELPFVLVEDSPSKTSAQDVEPHAPENKLHIREGSIRKCSKGEKRREENFLDEVLKLSNENCILKDEVFHETGRAEKAESDVQDLKKNLADVQVQKDAILLQYQQCLKRLSDKEGELNNAQNDVRRLDDKSSKSEIEVQTLKEALLHLEGEKVSALVKHTEYLQKISNLEAMISLVQEDRKGLDERAIKAQSEAQSLKDEILKLNIANTAAVDQYKQCLVKILDLEKVISAMEDEAKLLNMHEKRSEAAVVELQKALAQMNKEKEASTLKYKCCLETINQLEKDLSMAEVNLKHLENEALIGNAKFQNAEENCILLEVSNQSLRVEAENLVKKIAMKDQELSTKEEQLEKLENLLQEENIHCQQVEAMLKNLQILNSQSKDDNRALQLELKNVLQTVKDLEICKNGLEVEIQQVRDDNHSLSQSNLSSIVKMENMENEIISLRELKQKLEKEVSLQLGSSKSLQQEILSLKEEIKELSSYVALIEQVKAAGLNPACVGASLKNLEDENMKLRHICDEDINEKEILLKKLENMEEFLKKKYVDESSVPDLNGEKTIFILEKASLLSQLQAVTETMHRLLEKNAVLEDSLSAAKVELGGLREKSKGLEEVRELLKSERSHLLTERSTLLLKLENVERKLGSLENRFFRLEEEYADLEKEKNAVNFQVEELKVSLGVEKQERVSTQVQSETSFVGLQSQIHLLKEENKWKKNEYAEELERVLKSQFEISILQKFIKDMEEKNYSLIIECQKHVEASKLAEKVISELESESLEQQVETELLLDEIERLRLDVYRVLRALETGMDCVLDGNEQTFMHHILGNIEGMKRSISKYEDDKQQLLVENSVLVTVLKQLESKGMEIESQKIYFENELKFMLKNHTMHKSENNKIIKMNKQLKLDLSEGHQHAVKLEAELASLCVKQADLQNSYSTLQETYARVTEENISLRKKFSDLKEEKWHTDQQNDAAVLDFLGTVNKSAILRSFGAEKMMELKTILEDLNRQHEANCTLEKEMSILRGQLELQKACNLELTGAVRNLQMEIQGIRVYNVQMKRDMTNGKESLIQTEATLLDTEAKLEAAENLNLTLCKMVENLKSDIQGSLQTRQDREKSILQLSENNIIQKKEIKDLNSVNTDLESEIQDMNDEFELWEAETSAFHFELQVCSIHEVMFQNKVQELTGVYRSLESEIAAKTFENEQMKGKIFLMESEIGGLKSELNAYGPVITSLKDDIAFLEHNALLHSKLEAALTEVPEFLEVAAHPRRNISKNAHVDALLGLKNLQGRIKTVRKWMEETKIPVFQGRSISDTKQEVPVNETEDLKSRRFFGRDKRKLQKIKNKASKVWNGMLMKDIPVDQVPHAKRGDSGADDQALDLSETSANGKRDQTIRGSSNVSYQMVAKDKVFNNSENGKHKTDTPFTDSDVEKELGVDELQLSARNRAFFPEVNNRTIHDRLVSNAYKLEILQTTVQNLRTKLVMNQHSRKAKNVDFETIQEKLLEAEETILHLMESNLLMAENTEETPCQDEVSSPNGSKMMQRTSITEQARKGSEKIDRLQLELQKIQYILLKFEDEKKNKFFNGKTVIPRNFMYNGRKKGGKLKKSPLCGCLKPSSSINGRSL